MRRACAELGLTFKPNQKSYAWWGYSAGDYPVPEGFTADQLGHCEHAIGVPGTDWEIGLARPANGKGFRMLFDFYGHRGEPILKAIGGQKAGKFLQSYAVHKTMIEAQKRGLQVRRTLGENGSVNLTLQGASL